ncbi:MAG: fused MFS/spermidine synthase [Gemmatimonadaceae bacterium]
MLLFLCVVFVLSGAAGLIYESIWTRYLGLFVGHSAYAQVLVLVIFLGGMSLGAYAVGRRAERVRRPLLWYAVVELAIGMLGIVFHDVFVWSTQIAYDSLFPAIGPGAMHSVAKWVMASVLILPQSLLLGATFPLMTAGVLRMKRGAPGRTIALLYFANSLGAAVGVLFAGFVLIEASGLPGTLLAAAMLNLVVAGAAMIVEMRNNAALLRAAIGRGELPTSQPASSPAVDTAPIDGASNVTFERARAILLVVAFGTAVSSFIYEIGWIRMLSLVLGSATHSFELMLSAFIVGLASGAFYIRRRTESAASFRMLAYVQLAMGALAVATLPVYVQSFQWMADFMAAFSRSPAGYRAFSLSRYFICLVVMLPATFCAGMTLPLITRLLMRGERGERAIGTVYSVNTFGSIVGVILGALVLLPVLGLKWMLVAGASIDIALGVYLLVQEQGRTVWWERRRQWAPAFAAVAMLFLLGSLADFDRSVLTSGVFRYGTAKKAKVNDVVFYADGRTATVSVRRITMSGGLSLATNGKPDASLGPEWFKPPTVRGLFTHDASTQMLLPLLLLAHAPQAQYAAVIGQGSGMSSHTFLLDHRLKSLVTIEIEPEMIRASTKFYPANRRVFDDPRSTFAIDDARSYFAASGKKYDLVLSEPSTPWVAGVSGLFTTEFYSHVRRYLTPNGVFGQWLHLTEINDGLALSVVRAVAENFASYTIYAVGNRDILIVASQRKTLPPPDWSVVELPQVADALRRIYRLTPAELDGLHMADGATFAPLLGHGAANSDFYPSLDLGAERSRFLNEAANGFVGMVSDRFAIAPIMERRRAGIDGEVNGPVSGVPKLEAMSLAVRARDSNYLGAPMDMMGAAERARAVERMLSSNGPPVDWHVWVSAVRETEEMRAGGTSGYVDSAYFARVQHYMDAQHAPDEARAAIAFQYGLASWDFAQAAQAGDLLIKRAKVGDLWMPADVLREGVVLARLQVGDVEGARKAYVALAGQSQRDKNDVRPQLLGAWITAGESLKVALKR